VDTLWPVAAILCTGGADVIRKEAWFFYRPISSVRLCWELEGPEGPKRKPLNVCGLTSEVSVVRGFLSLTMGYHYGPSADLLVLVCVRYELLWPNSHPFEDALFAGSAATLCTGGLDVIRKEAWPFLKTISGVRLCWELEEPEGPKVYVCLF